jgi:hypothetical protein
MNFLDEEGEPSLGDLLYTEMAGLAGLAVERKSLMVIHEPATYSQYSPDIDMPKLKEADFPIICLPIMDKEHTVVEGCI